MSHLLVLQLQDDSIKAFDSMIALEDHLIEHIGDAADVDGHDVGSGAINIFIFTSEPDSIFLRTKPLLQQSNLLDSIIAAHRRIESNEFTVVWAEGYTKDFKVF